MLCKVCLHIMSVFLSAEGADALNAEDAYAVTLTSVFNALKVTVSLYVLLNFFCFFAQIFAYAKIPWCH